MQCIGSIATYLNEHLFGLDIGDVVRSHVQSLLVERGPPPGVLPHPDQGQSGGTDQAFLFDAKQRA